MSLTRFLRALIPAAAVVLAGCGTYHRHGLDPAHAATVEKFYVSRPASLSPELEHRILTLDPEHVSETDIRETLAFAPAPRIILIHGGLTHVIPIMVSFSDFLAGMGYPSASLTNADGTHTFSCYESSRMIAGMIAWYYEKEELRPMIVGHSQGGMQAVKILDQLAGIASWKVPVWNPVTWRKERRSDIIDPLTGQRRPAAALQLPYVTVMGAGGLTRMLPNQWDMAFRLRSIPDSVEEFTGFYKGMDLLGGDFLGFGPMNWFRAAGTARVRNVVLPAFWDHGMIPDTKHLLESQEIKDRINAYTPDKPMDVTDPANLNPETRHMMWAQDVWFSIKKHWVLELQRLIRARRLRAKGESPEAARLHSSSGAPGNGH